MDRTTRENLLTCKNQYVNPALLVLFVIIFPNIGDYHSNKWTILSGILVLLGVYKLPVSLSLKCWLGYFLINTLILSTLTDGLHIKLQAALKASGIETVMFITLPLVLLFFRNLDQIIKYAAIANILMTIFSIPFHSHRGWLSGGLVNPSMNAALTAMTIPFFYGTKHWKGLLAITAGLMLCSNGSTGPAALLAALLGIYMTKEKWWGAFIFSAAAAVLLILFYPEFLDPSGRVDIQIRYMKEWLKTFNVLVGSGGGSFSVWGPVWTAIARNDPNNNVWMWLHSDMLQCLFEYGISGVLLSCWVLIDAWLKGDQRVKGSLAALIMTCFPYYPFHFAPTVIIISALVFHALRDKIALEPTNKE